MINTIQDYCILWLTSESLIWHGMVWWNLTRKGFHCENDLWRKESKEPERKALTVYAQDANRELFLVILLSHYYSVFSFCVAWAHGYSEARYWLTGMTTWFFVCMCVKIYISRIRGESRKSIHFPGKPWDGFLFVISSKTKNFSSGRAWNKMELCNLNVLYL